MSRATASSSNFRQPGLASDGKSTPNSLQQNVTKGAAKPSGASPGGCTKVDRITALAGRCGPWVAIFFLLSSPLSAEESKRIGWQYYAFSLSGQMADAATTTKALDSGLREGNPHMTGIAGKPAVLFTVKAGIGLGVGLLGDRVYRHGVKHHSKGVRIAGKALPIVAGAAGFFAAGLNESRKVSR